ncbi:transporter substrate-binding domain-containing protein [Vibrio marisflavi]|uniref:Solute-binding protein family 3/N-terminal domain-containing protein n=1 Tax=Vibrio marisflavi CECT 7928 TaxID=634439 RepID=A0ABN8DY28_9VIBR|nr:transporter substrate-binding domain-containing protein [Vibrio marisflavi]CAH0536532.1 hypothetical protein VMF7928_00483 [Vibrio marisflavi CECT 7928]
MKSLFALIFLIASFQSAADSDLAEIQFVGGKYEDNPSTVYLIKLYTEAFRRIGYDFSYKQAPNKRSSIISDRGVKAAGELSRVRNYNDKHTNLIRLSIPHYSVRFVALAIKRPKLGLNGWNSLSDTDLVVTYRIGTKIIEEFLPKHVPSESIHGVVKVEQGLELLSKNRVDIYIEGDVNVYKFLKKDKYSQANIYIAGVMEELPIYMFIHKNYQDVIPKLNSAMKDMQEEGLFEKYRKEANFTPLSIGE